MHSQTNVLLIMPDQHRHDWCGYVGSDWCKTPNLDRLAAAGTVFTQCTTNSPLCAPARCSLATGRDPHHCGVLDNYHNLDPASPTMYQHLRDHGWWTGYVGKLDLAKEIGDAGVGPDGKMPGLYAWGFCDPIDSGGRMGLSGGDRRPYFRHLEGKGKLETFDRDRGAREKYEGAACASRKPHATALPEDWIAQYACDSLLEEEDHTDGFIGTLSEQWLERACTRTDPFFLQVNFHGPHDPYDPPVKWAEQFRDAVVPPAVPPSENPGTYQTRNLASDHKPSIEHARRQYSAVVAMIDDRIGRLVEVLKRHGKLEDTLIVFVSDHGDLMGDLGLFTKSQPYEGSLRVPLFVRGPDVAAGKRSDAIVQLADVYPTICELLGLPVPEGLDASSMAPVLRGQTTECRRDALSMMDHFVCLRTREWKYIANDDGSEELFDLMADPDEHDNLLPKAGGGDLHRLARARLAERVGDTWVGPKPQWWDSVMQLVHQEPQHTNRRVQQSHAEATRKPRPARLPERRMRDVRRF